MDISLMNIDISAFFKFPGILITIGLVLLIISIILIIIAYKSMEQPEKENDVEDKVERAESEVKIEENIEQDKKEETQESKEVKKPEKSIEKEQPTETQNKEEAKGKEEKSEQQDNSDDGFDLTKVFEISNNDNTKEFSFEEIKFEKSEEGTKPEDTAKDNNIEEDEEEIELL